MVRAWTAPKFRPCVVNGAAPVVNAVTDPPSANTESAGVEDAESFRGDEPAQADPGEDSTAEEEALLLH